FTRVGLRGDLLAFMEPGFRYQPETQERAAASAPWSGAMARGEIRGQGLLDQMGEGFLERQHALASGSEPADRDGMVLDLLPADGQDHGHMRIRMLADLVVDLLVPPVDLHPHAGGAEAV